MPINQGLFATGNIELETPQDFFDRLDEEFHFTLDPCATSDNAKCKHFYTREQDGLSKSWRGQTVFMNPPYGREIKNWVEKAYLEACESNTIVVCLLPARTDTRWWHDYCMQANEIRFVKGRLKFSDKGSAPFPNAVVVFRKSDSAHINISTMESK